ncbi:MAG: type IV pilus twitching motility protein PilT [Bacteroidales bacterium]
MALVESLLGAIVRPDGDALVLHVGEKPHIVAANGTVDLSVRPLTVDALTAILDQVLPRESRRALDDLGAVEYEIPPSPAAPGERFTMVAARGGDDIWVEIRRHRPMPASAPPAQADPRAGTPNDPSRPNVPAAGAPAPDAAPAVVLPLTRGSFRPDANARQAASSRMAGLDRLLRLAAARGATTLYIAAQSVPSIRVDGEIAQLEGEAALSASDVESLMLDLAPERSRQALESGEGTEWLCDVPDVGRVRCMSIRDHRGPGGIFRLIPGRAISAEQLGLSREILALCAEPGGLILVSGPRASGKSTLISAFVDLINRTRSDHVITLESEIKFVQESRSSLVSQREVRGDNDEWLAVARTALRENPDVLVIEQLRSPEIVSLSMETAESGRLVIGSLSANTATSAIVRMIEQYPAEERPHVQLTLAEVLRGAVSQVLLRKSGGGRVAARELLLNTASVATLIAEGKLMQLPAALESGRKHGMVPLNDALVAFVQSGAVDAREAYRKAFDREAFLSLLRREGIDTSFVERLA